MVSNASEDFPEPDNPVNTTSRSRGISTSMFFKLCSRAPRIAITRASGRERFLSNRSFMGSAEAATRHHGQAGAGRDCERSKNDAGFPEDQPQQRRTAGDNTRLRRGVI